MDTVLYQVYATVNALNNTCAQIFNSALGSSGSHSHALHQPHQYLSTHFRRVLGKCVGLGFEEEEVGEGSTHMRPNHSFEVQVVLVLVSVGVGEAEVGFAVVVGSRHPNQPMEVHVLELELEPTLVDELTARVVVTVGHGAGLDGAVEDEDVVVVESLQPNHPGVSQVVDELEEVLVEVAVVVVVSSKQPLFCKLASCQCLTQRFPPTYHHPGVLHVSVRVLVAVEVLLLVVVVSVPLLSKNFQRTQSVHSVSSSHTGTVSYSLITLSITV